MAEQTKVTAATMTTTQAPETNGDETTRNADGLSGKVYDNYEECEKNRPASAKKDSWKVFDVTRPDGTVAYSWGFTGINACNNVARADGYDVAAHGGRTRKPVDKGAVALDAYQHFTEDQMKNAGFPKPLIEAILESRKAAADQNPLNVAKAAKEAEQKAAKGGKKS